MKKRKFIMTAACVLALTALTGCKSKTEEKLKAENMPTSEAAASEGAIQQAAYQKLSPEEAKAKMEQEEVIIVDVRTEEEYVEKHIEGAILVPNESIGDMNPKELPDKDAQLLVYCRSGVRSKEASEKLLKLGYTQVYDIGGIEDWPYDNVDSGGLEQQMSSDTSGQPSFVDFKAVDLDGNEVNQQIFADYDLTMINIWGTFCGPCLREMPDLGEINREYEDQGFQIVGIVIDTLNQDGSISQKQVEKAKEVVDKTEADYVHLLPSEDLIQAKLQYVTGVPETIFVDKDGNLVGKSHIGSQNKESWIKLIDEYLKEVKE